MTGSSRVQEQHQGDLLLNSQVAGSRICGRSSSRRSYRPRPLSRRLFFQRVLAGSSWMSSLSRQFASVGTSFAKQQHSWINVLICIPCAWPAAIITFLRGGSWPECPNVFFSPSRSSHRKWRKMRLAHETKPIVWKGGAEWDSAVPALGVPKPHPHLGSAANGKFPWPG